MQIRVESESGGLCNSMRGRDWHPVVPAAADSMNPEGASS